MKKAIIRKSDGHVINVIEINTGSKYTPPDGCYLLDEKLSEKASRGKVLKDGQFIDIPKEDAKSDVLTKDEWNSLKGDDKLNLLATKLGIILE